MIDKQSSRDTQAIVDRAVLWDIVDELYDEASYFRTTARTLEALLRKYLPSLDGTGTGE